MITSKNLCASASKVTFHTATPNGKSLVNEMLREMGGFRRLWNAVSSTIGLNELKPEQITVTSALIN